MREHGAIITDGIQTASTQKCGHCGGHFIVVKSGYLPYCHQCDRITCGRLACLEHIPLEAQLEYAEGKKTQYDDAIRKIRRG